MNLNLVVQELWFRKTTFERNLFLDTRVHKGETDNQNYKQQICRTDAHTHTHTHNLGWILSVQMVVGKPGGSLNSMLL